VSFIVVFLYCVCALFVCNVCYLSVVLLYYCHRAEAQLQFNIYIYIYIYIVLSPSEPFQWQFLQEPHGVTSKKTPLFIVTAVKTSNLIQNPFKSAGYFHVWSRLHQILSLQLSVCSLFPVLFFNPEDSSNTFLRIGGVFPDYEALQSTSLFSSLLSLSFTSSCCWVTTNCIFRFF
jgi:hypothetical protein